MVERSKKTSKEVKKAIETIEDSGLSVYRYRRKERSFVKIYTHSLESVLPKISGNALKVFHALGLKMNYEDTVIQLSQKEIRELTNLSQHTIREALNELEELKIIKRLGPNNCRKYLINQMYIKKGK